MIDALIAGRLHGAPVARTTKAGKPFATCKVRVSTANGEAIFLSVVAFSGPVVTALLALADGDSAALAGTLTATAYTDKDGNPRPSLDLVAAQVLTEYHVARKRKAMRADNADSASSPADSSLPFDDELSGVA